MKSVEVIVQTIFRKPPIIFMILSLSWLSACGGGGSGGGSVNPASCASNSVSNLALLSSIPVSGASNVSVNTDIKFTFNTCVRSDTVNNANIMVFSAASLSQVSGSLSYDSATATVTFSPSQAFLFSDVITVTISSGGVGVNGETMSGPAIGFGFFLRDTPDTVKPITTSAPTDGYYNTPQNVTLSCDDGEDGTGCAQTRYTTNDAHATNKFLVYTNQITIDTSATLRFYSIDVEGNIEDIRSEDFIIDMIPPEVSSVTPVENAIEVVVTSEMTVQFNEAIDPGTITRDSVTVDNGVVVGLSLDSNTNLLTITPVERLACNTLHTVTLTTQIADLAGNTLVDPYQWSFTSTTDCEEPSTAVDVQHGVYDAAFNVNLNCTDNGGTGCAQIVYTTDGTIPSLNPVNGTVINGNSAGPIAIGLGETTLRYYAQDGAGNREVLRSQHYSVSDDGFVFAATFGGGLARGVGKVPTEFVPISTAGESHCFFVDSTNNRVYRCTQRGLYYSDDNGVTWQNLWSDGNVTSVDAVGSKIAIGTNSGLHMSIDGGATFSRTQFEFDSISDVIIHGYRMYVATNKGVEVSVDKGVSFSLKTTANGLGSNSISDLELNGDILYVATVGNAVTPGGVSISTDFGVSYANTDTSAGLLDKRVNVVKVVSSTVYAGTEAGLSISTDGGSTFTASRTKAEGLANDVVKSLLIDGSNFYIGHSSCCLTPETISVSTNGGTSFTARSFYPQGNQAVGTSTLAMVDGKLYVGAYPTYYVSSDSGVSYTIGGLPYGSLMSLAADALGNVYISANESSGYGGVIKTADLGRTFTISHTETGLGSNRVAQLYVNGSTLYAGTSSGLSVSNDQAASFNHFTAAANGLQYINVDVVYATGSAIYAGGTNSLDISTNNGGSFSNFFFPLPGSISDMDIFGSNIYVSTTSGLLVSNNNGVTSNTRTTADGLGGNYLNTVAVDATGNVYVGELNTGLSISTNSGLTFTDVPIAGVQNVESIRIQNNVIYLGTGNGVAISDDNAASFRVLTVNNGLPATRINDVIYLP